MGNEALGGRGAPRQRVSGWARGISRDDIVASIADWKFLGRDAFLTKYRVNAALRYVLVDGAEEFDAKAILHGAQILSGLTLNPGNMRGSREDVAEPLRDLGFWVEDQNDEHDAPFGSEPASYIHAARSLLGGTDGSVLVRHRLEQKIIRGALGFYRDYPHEITCQLCIRHVPRDLAVAAHIKRRADCSEEERLDVQNIAMVSCRLGCDALFVSTIIEK